MAPEPGEAIDSWLEATAGLIDLPLGSVARALDLALTTRPVWIRWLSRTQLETVEAATGVSSNIVEAMTLSVYDGTALQLHPDSHRLDPTFPFGALSRSRYCPKCLAETQGRWQLVWRLGWSFVCLIHNCLLADACPRCGKYQRHQQVYRRVPTPTMCVCGHSLGATPTVELPAGHVIVDAQQQVLDVINDGATSFGVFEGNRSCARDVLAATRSLANRVLNYAATHGLKAVKSAEVSWLIGGDGESKSSLARNALNDTAPSRAIEAAIGVTAALHILRSPTIQDAGNRARPIIEQQNADTGPAELRSCPRDGAIPAAIAIEARSHDMGPELQLRYRTAITMPCVPDLVTYRVAGIAAALPAVMWPAWSDRLLPDLRRTTVARMTLSCATLLAGSTVKTVAAARLLGETITANALNQRLWMLRNSAYWQSICAALVRLSDYLDDDGAPINYQRRRNLDYSALLPEGLWQQICTQTDNPVPEPRTAVAARCYLIETLSGSPAPALLTLNDEVDEHALARLCVDFRRSMSTRRAVLLADLAQGFLEQHGIGEPVFWHPPLDLLADLHLLSPG